MGWRRPILREGPLRGRDVELEQLRRGIDAARDGRSHVIFVEGEPGAGKTRLVAEALAEARAAGLLVASATCEEFGRSRPFGALASALDLDVASPAAAELIASITALVGRRSSQGTRRDLGHHIIEDTVDLIDGLSSDRPVVLALDDLQWADPSTIEALGAIGRRLRHNPVLLMGAARPSPRLAELDRVMDVLLADGGVHVRLAPLDPDAAAGLAGDALSATLGATVLQQVRSAGGNPLYIIELMRALLDEGAIDVSDGCAESRSASVPPSLMLTLVRRLNSLPEQTLDVLRVAAVLGTSFSLRHVSLLCGRSAVELMTVLEPALQAGLLGDAGESLCFRHDLVRKAIYENLPVAVRKAVHADAGRRLSAAGADVSEIFEHVSLGATEGDRDALDWLETTAMTSAGRAPRLAVAMLERALSITGDRPARRQSLEASLVEALTAAGRLVDAEALARHLLGADLDPPLDARVRSALGRSLVHQGRSADAVEQLDLAAERADVESEKARCLAMGAVASTFLGALDSEDRIRVALAAGRSANDDVAAMYATTALASSTTHRGYLSEGAEIACRAGELANKVWREEPLPYPVVHLLAAERVDDVERILHTGLWSDEHVRPAYQPTRHSVLALRRFLIGEWDDAVTYAETAIDLAGEIDSRWNVGTALSVLCCVAVHRNDLEAAGRHEAALRRGQYPETPWASALVFAARSDDDGLRSLLEGLRGALFANPEAYFSLGFSGRDWVRFYLDMDDVETARTLAAGADELSRRADVPGTTADALYCRGLVDGDLESLLESVDWFRRSPSVLGLAEACEATALTLARAGHRTDALPLITEARDIYERLQAHRDTSRVDAVFRQFGWRRRPTGARRRPSVGWDSLTPAELKVVRLITQGLTYREAASALYISKRTVETHAAHIFRKLGISTRRELQEIVKEAASREM